MSNHLSNDRVNDVPPAASTHLSPDLTIPPKPNPPSHLRHHKRFARSAAKRQSIHLLGSISHLQQHFTKFGLASSAAEEEQLRSKVRGLRRVAVDGLEDGGSRLRAGTEMGRVKEEEEEEELVGEAGEGTSSRLRMLDTNVQDRSGHDMAKIVNDNDTKNAGCSKPGLYHSSYSPAPTKNADGTRQLPERMEKTTKVDLHAMRREVEENLREVEDIWRLREKLPQKQKHEGQEEGKNEVQEDTEEEKQEQEEEEVEKNEGEDPIDLLDILQKTISTIRSVRAYTLAVPSSSLPSSVDHPSFRRTSLGHGLGPHALRTPQTRHSISTPSRPVPASSSASSSSGANRVGSIPYGFATHISSLQGKDTEEGVEKSERDPLSDLRKVALDVLAGLRAVEERYRVVVKGAEEKVSPSGSGLYERGVLGPDPSSSSGAKIQNQQDESYGPAHSLARCSPSSSISTGPGPGTGGSIDDQITGMTATTTVALSDDPEFGFDPSYSSEEEKSERLVLSRPSWTDQISSGSIATEWTYPTNLRIVPDLEEERMVVGVYVQLVVEVIGIGGREHLESGAGGKGKGEERQRRSGGMDRRVSAGGRLESASSFSVALGSRSSSRGDHNRQTLPNLDEGSEDDNKGLEDDASDDADDDDDEGVAASESQTTDQRQVQHGQQMPRWAQNTLWEGKDIERLHAFMAQYLPLSLVALLPHPDSPDFSHELLRCLSDGFLLAIAFNASLDSPSLARWGYIPMDDIHDTLALTSVKSKLHGEEEESGNVNKEWTFRKIANLKAWAAAIKLRHAIPISLPHQPESRLVHLVPLSKTYERGSSTTGTLPSESRRAPSSNGGISSDPTTILFNPTLVAKREYEITSESEIESEVKVDTVDTGPSAKALADWEQMLLRVCREWLDAVQREIEVEIEEGERSG